MATELAASRPGWLTLLRNHARRHPMASLGLGLALLGVLALLYGGFSYTKETHTADLGPLHISVAEKERVNVPMWAGVGAIVIGGLLLVVSGKR